jgi:hypothetical protein
MSMNRFGHVIETHPSEHPTFKRRSMKWVFATCTLGLVLVLGLQWPSRESDAAHRDFDANGTLVTTPNEPFQYFPAQYENRARQQPPEEHIQAF